MEKTFTNLRTFFFTIHTSRQPHNYIPKDCSNKKGTKLPTKFNAEVKTAWRYEKFYVSVYPGSQLNACVLNTWIMVIFSLHATDREKTGEIFLIKCCNENWRHTHRFGYMPRNAVKTSSVRNNCGVERQTGVESILGISAMKPRWYAAAPIFVL